MSLHNFNLRSIEPEIMILLKREAKKKNLSVNALIRNYIESCLGINQEEIKTIHHDLDHLAGSWSSADAKIFEKNTKYFEQIDEELWK